MIEPARSLASKSFVVAGPLYPERIAWPATSPGSTTWPRPRTRFYAAQRYTLNVTRADMVAAGWSPSVRLFEAASCGVPIISDAWDGLDELFRPGDEILPRRRRRPVRILHDLRELRCRDRGGGARAGPGRAHLRRPGAGARGPSPRVRQRLAGSRRAAGGDLPRVAPAP